MATQCAEQITSKNLLKKLLRLFQLHIDDLSAKPCQPILCTINLAALLVYHVVSIWLLWSDGSGALISTILNTLCVLRGFCKVMFNQKIYREKVHTAWTNCTQENRDFINNVCNPYFRMYLLELVTLIAFCFMLLAIRLGPIVYFVECMGTLVLAVAFLGDCVDVLSDMYRAHPPMPVTAR